MSAGGWHADVALATGLYGLLAGLLVPTLIGRIPEPEPDDATSAGDEDGSAASDRAGSASGGREVPKEAYAVVARLPRLRVKASLATGVVAALLGWRVGWAPELSFLLYLAPVGVALAVVDWRTHRLPTKVIAPSYFVVAALAAASAWAEADWSPLVTAGLGWLVFGGVYFLLWFVYPDGMGYGDVRLSGVLGIALGYLGWGELLTGMVAGLIVGGIGGLTLALLKVVDRRASPFGPFMLIGAVLGVLLGPGVAAWYV